MEAPEASTTSLSTADSASLVPPAEDALGIEPETGEHEAIGLEGGSGHTQLDLLKFNGANFAAFMASYWCVPSICLAAVPAGGSSLSVDWQ